MPSLSSHSSVTHELVTISLTVSFVNSEGVKWNKAPFKQCYISVCTTVASEIGGKRCSKNTGKRGSLDILQKKNIKDNASKFNNIPLIPFILSNQFLFCQTLGLLPASIKASESGLQESWKFQLTPLPQSDRSPLTVARLASLGTWSPEYISGSTNN